MPFRIRFSQAAAAGLMALVLTAILLTQAAPAAAPDNAVKIGTIDTEKILLTSIAGKKALADLKKQQEQAEAQGKSMQQEVKDLQTKITDGRLTISQDQLANLNKQLEEKVIAVRRFQDDATRLLTKKRDEVLADIDQKVMPVINQVGKEMGYTAIFRKFESGLIYANDSIDLTAVIIQRLDATVVK